VFAVYQRQAARRAAQPDSAPLPQFMNERAELGKRKYLTRRFTWYIVIAFLQCRALTPTRTPSFMPIGRCTFCLPFLRPSIHSLAVALIFSLRRHAFEPWRPALHLFLFVHMACWPCYVTVQGAR
jgi:hypothetical protein